MRILLIHQAFVGPDEPGGTRHFEFARYCAREGHEFTVVGGSRSYLTGKHAGDERTYAFGEGKIFVRRAYTHSALHKSFFWRVISFLSFMFSSVWTALRSPCPDLVMGTSPPIFQAVSAWFVAVLLRRPFLLEIRDLWPEFAIDMGVLRNRALISLSRMLERFLYSRATHILVNSPAYRDYVVSKGIPAEKVTLVANGVEVAAFDPDANGEAARVKFNLDSRFLVVYTGALGMANDIPTLLHAARELEELPEIKFVLFGDGKERNALEALSLKLGLQNVVFSGSVSKSGIPDVLAAADVCIATLLPIPMFTTTYPNKVFDYMAAGRPTVLAIDGVIREVIESSEGGIFVKPGDPSALAAAIRFLYENPAEAKTMGRSARQYVERHFSRTQQAAAFECLLFSLAK